MSEFFLSLPTEEDLNDESILDGKQRLVPNDTELECLVTDAFIGLKEGTAIQVCYVYLQVVQPGPYLGYRFRYNAKIFDNKAEKRDLAKLNLTRIDAQAGSPLAKKQKPITTENMQECWVGIAFIKAKIGVYTPDDIAKSPGNYVAGFGYLREKLPQNQESVQQPQQAVPQNASAADDSEIDF